MTNNMQYILAHSLFLNKSFFKQTNFFQKQIHSMTQTFTTADL